MAAASRWVLRWFLESPHSADDDDQSEWERQNDFLIPAAPKETPTAQYASSPKPTARVPIHRSPSRPSHSTGCHNSYGRFGKSCPPGLEPPIERHDEEEEAQEDGAGRGLRRALSAMTINCVPKRRSIDCALPQQTSDTSSAHWCLPLSRTDADGHVSPFSGIPAAKLARSEIQQLWQLQSLHHQGHGNGPSAIGYSDSSFQQPKAAFSASDAFCQTNTLMQDDSTLGLQQSDGQLALARCSTHSSALDVLLDESVQDLGASTLMLNSAPVLIIGRAATMDALHSSLSEASLHTMLLDEPVKKEQPVSAPKPYSSAAEAIDVVPAVHDSLKRHYNLHE